MPNSFSRKSPQEVSGVQQTDSARTSKRPAIQQAKTKVRSSHTSPQGGARRGAYVRPAILGSAMLFVVAASILWAVAAASKKPTTPAKTSKPTAPAKVATPSTGKGHRLDWSDLPALMKAYGQRRAQAAKGKYGTRRFALTEADLTPNTPSDEREVSYSFNGDYIAFSSNGTQIKDASGNTRLATGAGAPIQAHYHIWIMKNDGTGQRQITGLTISGPDRDDNRDQRFPAWDPAGNQIVYTDRGLYPADTDATTTKTELYIVRPFDPLVGNLPHPPTERRTFSGGDKRRPSFSSSGLAVAFATNVDPRIDNTVKPAVYDALPSFDIFTIDPSGTESSVVRITGTTTPLANGTSRTDATGDTLGDSTSDLNPAFSQVNANILFFSSDRDGGTKLAAGRRIWLSDSSGRNRRQVTDPTQRQDPATPTGNPTPTPVPVATPTPGGAPTPTPSPTPTPATVGTAADTDDFPAPSATQGSFSERVGFQSDSYIDATDDVHDLNIWSLSVSSNNQFIAPALIVGSFGDADRRLHKFSYPSGASNGLFNATSTSKTEDVLFGPTNSNGGASPNLFVSQRSASRVEIFDGATGTDLGTFAQAADLLSPTGLAFDAAGNLYVADGDNGSGTPPAAGSTQGRRVHRFHPDGSPFPAAGQPVGSSIFTDGGGTDANTNGFEGITFGPNDSGQGPDLFVSSIKDGVLEYNGTTGAFIRKVVPIGAFQSDATGLNVPTGLAFGPDGKLYVCSSFTDSIKRYTVTATLANTPPATQPTYNFDMNYVTDNDGTVNNLNDPERLRFGPDGNLYVSSLTKDGDPQFGKSNGDHISRYFGPLSGSPGAPDPSAGHTGAIFAQDTSANSALVGPSGFDFNPSASGTTPAIEINANQAVVETNRTSSPRAAGNSMLTGPNPTPNGSPSRTGIDEDRSADREPGFSGQTLAVNQTALLAFSSQRKTAAAPGSNDLDPTPVVQNPFGGPQGAGDTPPTHDIWTTRSQDFTPPVLLAQSVGALKYPVISPGPQAPVIADTELTSAQKTTINGQYRTFESGLRPDDGTGNLGTKVTIGVVIQETESGLGSGAVTATIRDADQPNFVTFTPGNVVVIGNTAATGVDENIPITAAREIDPSIVPGMDALPMRVYDDGPPSQGGHELEGAAIAGDGIYYCVVTTTTPTNAGDFYIDINTKDRAGNRFTFDHVWGFSTRQFAKSSAASNLFVSDYTVGQLFPYQLTSNGTLQDVRYNNMIPVESYFLTNPGGFGAIDPSVPTPDTWRILCRGPVPQTIFDRYTPTVTFQLDYNKDFAGGRPKDYPNTPKTKSLAVATSAVVWGAPYAGLVFAGPGTIIDANSQNNLTHFLDNGGRFFLSGQDVLYSLSGQGGGTPNNTFIQNELRAAYKGEANPTVLTVNPAFPITFLGGDFDNLHLPLNYSLSDTYIDAALNRRGPNPRMAINTPPGVSAGFDLMTPATGTSAVASQTTVFDAYTTGGSTVGQYIEQTRTATGRESRVAFFGFGFEQIDRRYTNPSAPRNLNVRWRVCRNLLDKFFETAAISGQVVDTTTNQPVQNFLVQAVFRPGSTSTGVGQTFIAQTDANGRYSFIGLPPTIPSDDYTVQPALDSKGKTLNPGYRGATPVDLGGSVFGAGTSTANFLVTSLRPGTLTGVVKSTNGTADTSDDTPIPNVPVLVKSGELGVFPGFPNGGRFAQLVTTDAGGRFSVSGVPASDLTTDPAIDIPLTVILNPNDQLESDTSKSVNGGDIPDNAGINYGAIGTNPTLTPRTDLRRRQLPDSKRPATIRAVPGDVFILNENDPTDPTDPTSKLDNGQPLLLSKGPSISGKVTLNGKPVGGAVVTFQVAGETGPRSTTTVSDGSYTFFDVPPGNYTLTATGPAPYSNATGTVTVPIANANSDDITNANIALFKQDVTGTIIVNSGALSPAGFTVTLVQADRVTPVPGFNPVVTDNTGTFTFLNVPAGASYAVQAVRGTLSQTTPTFFINKGVDQNLTIQFFVRSITGTVFLNGAPVGGASVQLFASDKVTKVGPAITTASDGTYTFPTVPPGTYYVQATIQVGTGTDTSPLDQGKVVVQTAFDATAPDLQLFLEKIVGTVTVNGGLVSGITVELNQPGAAKNPIATTTTAADGSYSFANLTGNVTYTVTASYKGDSKSVSKLVPRATSVSTITVTFPTIPLLLETVAGRVTLNGTPLAKATVNLIDPVTGKVIATTVSSPTGLYSFDMLPAGNYILQAVADPTVLNSVGAGTGDTVQINITVVRGVNLTAPDLQLVTESISGRVTLNGQPTSGATVNLIQNNTVLKTVVTGSDGTYSFTNLLPGGYLIQANKGGDSAAITVTVARGDRLTSPAVPDIQLFLQTITGKVLLNGKPLKGATVLLIRDRITRARVATDAGGNYKFTDLLPGTYAVRALYGGDEQTIIVRLQRGRNVTAPLIQLKLETATGRVLLNGKPVAGATVVMTQGNKTIGQKTTATDGTYSFTNLPAGAYRITASKSGVSVSINVTVVRGVNLRIPDIQLRTQSITGQVLLNGAPAANATVLLIRADGTPFGRTTTGADGRYSFANLPAGTYTVRAIVKGVTKDLDINVRTGISATLPAIRITIATPTPTPGPTPTPAGPDEFTVGQTYQITIPYADSTSASAATTAAKAFTLPMVSNGVQNYRLFRYNARTEKYEELTSGSALHRGEGYFLRPESSGVSLRRPPADPTRKALGDTKFTIVLHNNPSIAATDPHNGFNLIGSPFNPAVYTGADFLNSQVILPNGRVYNTVNEAVAAGIISGSLFTFDETTGDYTEIRGNLTNFKGYYVRTFVDGVRLVLKPNLGG